MSTEKEKGRDKTAICVAIIAGTFTLLVAIVNKCQLGTHQTAQSEDDAGKDTTTTAHVAQHAEVPDTVYRFVQAKTPPAPAIPHKGLLRLLDKHIADTSQILQDNMDVDRYNTWRAGCLNLLNTALLKCFADQFHQAVPKIEKGGNYHRVQHGVREGVQLLKNARDEIAIVTNR